VARLASWRSSVYARQLDLVTGARRWIPDGVPLCLVPSVKDELAGAAGNTGDGIVAWTDDRSG
jgi:hypothetical protein